MNIGKKLLLLSGIVCFGSSKDFQSSVPPVSERQLADARVAAFRQQALHSRVSGMQLVSFSAPKDNSNNFIHYIQSRDGSIRQVTTDPTVKQLSELTLADIEPRNIINTLALLAENPDIDFDNEHKVDAKVSKVDKKKLDKFYPPDKNTVVNNIRVLFKHILEKFPQYTPERVDFRTGIGKIIAAIDFRNAVLFSRGMHQKYNSLLNEILSKEELDQLNTDAKQIHKIEVEDNGELECLDQKNSKSETNNKPEHAVKNAQYDDENNSNNDDTAEIITANLITVNLDQKQAEYSVGIAETEGYTTEVHTAEKVAMPHESIVWQNDSKEKYMQEKLGSNNVNTMFANLNKHDDVRVETNKYKIKVYYTDKNNTQKIIVFHAPHNKSGQCQKVKKKLLDIYSELGNRKS